jgi:hypothetical protein
MENSDLLSAQANLVQEVVATINKQGDALTQNVETPLNGIVSHRPAIWTGNGGDAFDGLINAEIGPGLEAILGQIKNLATQISAALDTVTAADQQALSLVNDLDDAFGKIYNP